MNKPHHFILNGNNTIRDSPPLLSPGEDTTRLNPLQSTSPIEYKINLVSQTKQIDQREIQSYHNHA